MRIGTESAHRASEIGRFFVDDQGNYVYRQTENGKEVIARAETYAAAEFICMAVNKYEDFKLK